MLTFCNQRIFKTCPKYCELITDVMQQCIFNATDFTVQHTVLIKNTWLIIVKQSY